MVYAIIAGGVFLSDLILKRYMDKKYARKVRHPRLGGRIVLEKYYNKGAALNFMVKKPNLLRIIHTVILVVVGVFSYFLMRLSGHALEKTGPRPLPARTRRRPFSSALRSARAARDRLQPL